MAVFAGFAAAVGVAAQIYYSDLDLPVYQTNLNLAARLTRSVDSQRCYLFAAAAIGQKALRAVAAGKTQTSLQSALAVMIQKVHQVVIYSAALVGQAIQRVTSAAEVAM